MPSYTISSVAKLHFGASRSHQADSSKINVQVAELCWKIASIIRFTRVLGGYICIKEIKIYICYGIGYYLGRARPHKL